jgi:hypothetical protein
MPFARDFLLLSFRGAQPTFIAQDAHGFKNDNGITD